MDQRREHGNMADAAHATATDEAKVAANAAGVPDTGDNDDVRGSGDDVGSGGGDGAAAKKVLKPPVWNPSALAAPIRLSGEVVRGFGRGSKMLGIPTANLPPEAIDEQVTDEHNGVFFGWASVGDGPVYKTVLSIGWCVHDMRAPGKEGKGRSCGAYGHLLTSVTYSRLAAWLGVWLLRVSGAWLRSAAHTGILSSRTRRAQWCVCAPGEHLPFAWGVRLPVCAVPTCRNPTCCTSSTPTSTASSCSCSSRASFVSKPTSHPSVRCPRLYPLRCTPHVLCPAQRKGLHQLTYARVLSMCVR